MTQHPNAASALQGPVVLHEWTLDAEAKAKFGTRCTQKSVPSTDACYAHSQALAQLSTWSSERSVLQIVTLSSSTLTLAGLATGFFFSLINIKNLLKSIISPLQMNVIKQKYASQSGNNIISWTAKTC